MTDVTESELALALWSTNADRHRALELARLARDAYRDHGEGATPGALAEIQAWLAERAN